MTPPTLLALDPGLPDLGAALFVRGQLAACRWCRVPPAKDHAGRARALVALLDEVDALGEPGAVVVEWPEMLPRRGEWVDPAGLLWVAGVAAAALDRAAALGAELHAVTPRQWKGSLPKEQHQKLHLRTLSVAEQALVPVMPRAGRPQSDALDAALLGVWWLRAHGWRR